MFLTQNVAMRVLVGCDYKREGQWFGEQVTRRPNNFRHIARTQLNLPGFTVYHKIVRLNMYNVCFRHSQNNYRVVALNVFLTFMGACKYILQSVTLQIHFSKTFYVVQYINRNSKPHQVPVMSILLGYTLDLT